MGFTQHLRARRHVIALGLGLLAMLVLAFPAGAGVSWCRADPIVKLNGTQVQILVGVPEQYVALVNGPLAFTIKTPAGVTQELIMTDAGFNGHGETVAFTTGSGTLNSNGSFATDIRVRVPIDEAKLPSGEKVPVEVTVIVGNAAPIVVYGYANNTTLELDFSLLTTVLSK